MSIPFLHLILKVCLKISSITESFAILADRWIGRNDQTNSQSLTSLTFAWELTIFLISKSWLRSWQLLNSSSALDGLWTRKLQPHIILMGLRSREARIIVQHLNVDLDWQRRCPKWDKRYNSTTKKKTHKTCKCANDITSTSLRWHSNKDTIVSGHLSRVSPPKAPNLQKKKKHKCSHANVCRRCADCSSSLHKWKWSTRAFHCSRCRMGNRYFVVTPIQYAYLHCEK